MKIIRLILVPCLLILVSSCSRTETAAPLICHVGGTMRPVMEKLAQEYTDRTGQPIEINAAGSGELLVHIQQQKRGDVYICHDPFLDILMGKYKTGLDGWEIAHLTPVIVVQKGNPKGIRSLQDITKPDVQLCLTDYKHSTLGWMLPTIFSRSGIDFDALNKSKVIVHTRSGGQAANMVKSRNLDAALCWDAVAHLRRDGLDIIPIQPEYLPVPGIDAVTTATDRNYILSPVKVTLATLTCSTDPAAAQLFAEFVVSKEASETFREFGFTSCVTKKLFENGKAYEKKLSE